MELLFSELHKSEWVSANFHDAIICLMLAGLSFLCIRVYRIGYADIHKVTVMATHVMGVATA